MYSNKTFNTKKAAVADESEMKSWPPKVTFVNPKTKEIVKRDNYIFRDVGLKGSRTERTKYLEWPAGSGNLWTPNWEPNGRWDTTKKEGERYLADAAHIAWAPPETSDQKLAKQFAENTARIAELEKELAAIQAEKAPKPKKDSGA